MKNKFNFKNVFILGCILVFTAFILYFFSNVIPRKTKYEFQTTLQDQSFINDYEIENKNERKAIFLNIKDTVFKEYNYHSYISGEGNGRKIQLQMYLISKDKKLCYKIKSNCYEYQKTDELKIIGYYYNNFIEKNEKYNLAIYVPDTEILYITNIEI